MALRTPEQLQQMLEERKRIQQRKKEKEREKYKKASEQVKQELKKRKIQENQNNTVQEPLKYKYNLTIYQSPLIERETAETDLYQTREELMEAEDRGEGQINWEIWQQLIDKLNR